MIISNKFNKTSRVIVLALFVLFMNSCKSNKWSMPSRYLGAWQSATHKITVRTYINKEEYKTITDTINAILILNKDKTASGTIGYINFENIAIKQVSKKTEITGDSYVVKLKDASKLFDRDPIAKKELEIWFSPINGRIEAELREVNGRKLYRMGVLKFQRRKY